MDLKDFRQNYDLDKLKKKHLDPNPINQFKNWMKDAVNAECLEPNAMVLATLNKDMVPTSRVVLLKEVLDGEFVFYTNYESDKARDISVNNKVSLVFNWLKVHKQIRVEGIASKVSKEVSEAYFQSRPIESQVGAYASPQSKVIENRKVLKQNLRDTISRFEGLDKLPLPDNWGGYTINPFMIEFWQGRESRLHDRFRYTKQGNDWKLDRLAP